MLEELGVSLLLLEDALGNGLCPKTKHTSELMLRYDVSQLPGQARMLLRLHRGDVANAEIISDLHSGSIEPSV